MSCGVTSSLGEEATVNTEFMVLRSTSFRDNLIGMQREQSRLPESPPAAWSMLQTKLTRISLWTWLTPGADQAVSCAS
jgi:hypothetical protein